MEKPEKPKIEIYTDGACEQNPGKGGIGVVLIYKDSKENVYKKEFSKGYKYTTNNRMELTAVIEALKLLNRPCDIKLYSDSRYVVDSINQRWLDGWINAKWRINTKNPVKNIDLWQKFLSARTPHKIEFIWVKGHASNKYNELCDKLAVEARNKNELEDDEGAQFS